MLGRFVRFPDSTSDPAQTNALSRFAEANLVRFASIAVIIAFALHIAGQIIHEIWSPPFVYDLLTLFSILLLMLPAVLVVAVVRERPFVRWFLVLAGVGLVLTVLLDLTTDIAAIADWPVVGRNSAIHNNLRWLSLIGGIYLLFSALYLAVGELMESQARLQKERRGLLKEMQQRRLAEERARTALDYAQRVIQTANVIVIGLDADRNLKVFNAEAERITGYTRAELSKAGWFDVLMPPDRYPNIKERLSEYFNRGIPKHFESPITTKAGEDRLIAWSNSEVYEGGQFTGTISFGLDITDRKKAEAELLRSGKLATLGVVAAGLAHEIGNPLSSLSTRLSLMEEDNDPEFWRESMKVLSQQITRISRIVRGVTRFSRPPRPDISECNVNALLMDALDVVRFHELAKNCQIGTALASSLPVVMAAADQLLQVFLNLALNALEAMPNGGSLSVKTRADGDMVEISFCDSGVGISDEVKEKLFETFFTTKSTGMGMGLSIARSVVSNHGGRLECENHGKGGAVFRVLLPVACAAHRTGDSPEA